MSAIIGALRAILSLESAAFTNGLKSAQGSFDRFAKNADRIGQRFQRVGAIITIAGAGMAAAVRGSLNHADEMGKAAQKFGVPVEQLSKLAYAAKLSDVSLETLGTGLKKLSQGMVSNSKAFADIGVQTRDATGALRDTEAVLQDVSAVFAAMPDGAEKTAMAVKLFGKSGADMIPMLNAGKAGLAAMAAEAQKMGIVITPEQAAGAEKFNDAVTKMQVAFSALAIGIASDLAPGLTQVVEWMTEVITKFQELDPATREWVEYAAVAFAVGGPVLVGLGLVATAIGGLAILFSPALLMIGAVAAGAGLIAYYWDDIKAIFADIWQSVKDAADVAWTAIKDAIGAAFDWITTKAEAFLAKLQQIWQKAKDVGSAVAEALSTGREEMNSGDGYEGMGGAMDDPSAMFGGGGAANVEGGAAGDTLGAYAKGAAIGTALADGTVDGFKNGMKARTGDIAAAAGIADDVARDRLGIRSPSRVFREIGAFLTEGLSLGMKDNLPMVGGAMDEIGAELKTGADSLASAVQELTSSFQGLFKGIVTGSMSGKEAIAGLADKLADMLADSAFNSLFSPGSGIFGNLIPNIASIFGFAKGGVFQGGNVTAFADGGVVAQATNFAMSGGRMGLMGEAGPEAIMPLTRGPGGKLGVQAHGGGGTLRVVIEEGPMFAARVEAISGDTAVEVVRGYDNEVAPASRSRNPRERG
jgi:Phage-related minor tail protein